MRCLTERVPDKFMKKVMSDMYAGNTCRLYQLQLTDKLKSEGLLFGVDNFVFTFVLRFIQGGF